MTAEELYKEFIEVTHIDESFVDHYQKICTVQVEGSDIIKDAECIAVFIKSPRGDTFLTYFHKEEKPPCGSKILTKIKKILRAV